MVDNLTTASAEGGTLGNLVRRGYIDALDLPAERARYDEDEWGVFLAAYESALSMPIAA